MLGTNSLAQNKKARRSQMRSHKTKIFGKSK